MCGSSAVPKTRNQFQLISANRDAIECVQETQFCQCFNGVWERVNTNAEFTYPARLLEHLALDADGV
jgi:hypothetical protein